MIKKSCKTCKHIRKGIGCEYQARRPGNRGGVQPPGPGVKRITHHLERRHGDRAIAQGLIDAEQDPHPREIPGPEGER